MNKPLSILILEDNISDAELVQYELRKAGFDFTARLAKGKTDFLAALETFHPDLMLADYSLPGFDGITAMTLVRHRFGDIPVILVSGAIGEETAIEALKAGATDYVLKQRLQRLGPVVRRAFQEAEQLAKRKRAEERLALVASATQIGIFDWNIISGRIFWSLTHESIFGYAPPTTTTTTTTTTTEHDYLRWADRVHPEDLPLIEEESYRCMQERKPLEMQYRIIWPDGSLHWVETKGVFLHDSDGNFERMLGVVMDITARKQAEEQIKASLAEKEVMLREIHHRVKNNLQVISSLISLQADNLTDERMRQGFSDVRDRVRSMALIHEQLYQTSDLARLNFADYAVSLLHSLWRSHGALAEKVQLNLALAPVTLSIETAMPCGLILNELAGNALKHAFPGSNCGEVTVGLEHDSITGAVSLQVRDNGVGLPAGLDWRQSPSLGLHLVQILAGQLCGTVETGIGPGAEFNVTFPLDGC